MPKISRLPAAAAAQLTDLVAAVQGTVTKKETLQQIMNLFSGSIVITEAQVTGLIADLASKLPLAGGTMSGAINMDGSNITNVGTASFSNSGFTVGFSAPTLAGNSSYTWPTAQPGVNGYVLSCSTAGVMSWVPNTAGSLVSVVGTANQIDVDNTDPQNPVLSLSSTVNMPGTFNIQSTTAIDKILDEDNMASDSATALATQQSIKYYADHLTQILDSNNNPIVKFQSVASAVNYFSITNSATLGGVVLNPEGTDSNIGLIINGKGDGIVEIQGCRDGSNPTAGYIGQTIAQNVNAGSAVGVTSGSSTTVASILLTPGDWDVWGNIGTVPNAATTQSRLTASISLVNNTHPTPPGGGAYNQLAGLSIPAGQGTIAITGSVRINVSANTTVYLVGESSFAVSTNALYGYIGARRRR